jgi:hypothetical protein
MEIKKLDLDERGEWDNTTYEDGTYYINNSGFLCRLPSVVEDFEKIRESHYEDEDRSLFQTILTE